MALSGGTAALAGLVALGLAEIPQVMSGFLPSPATAYRDGGDADLVAWLRREEKVGSVIALGIAVAVSMIAADEAGPAAWWIFIGAVIILGIFLYEYERAIRKGAADGRGGPGEWENR